MGLEGKLTDMPLLDLLRVFQRGARGGKLTLWSESEWAGLWFVEGHVVSGVVLSMPGGRPLRIGEEAIYHLFTWSQGHFRFSPGAEVGRYPTTITRPTSILIVEALRRRNPRASTAAPDELTMHTPLSVLPQTAGVNEHIQLSVEEWSVLTHIRQQTTVQSVVEQTRLSPERVLTIVSRLIDYGLVMCVPLADLPQRRLAVESGALAVGSTPGDTPITNLTRAIKRRLRQIAVGA